MRLLNTKSLEVEEFFDENIPPYAILSHTWGDGEVSFQDIQSPEFARQARAGFAKVESACALASSQGHAHIWIDTCCIDKTSSAELSEAINSMYSWYKRASICYAYLVDVEYLGRSNMVPQAEAEIEEGDGGKENGGHFTEGILGIFHAISVEQMLPRASLCPRRSDSVMSICILSN